MKEDNIEKIINEKNNYIKQIKTCFYKEDYEKIEKCIENLKKNFSAEKILELSDMIKKYKDIYEFNILNTIKIIIREYNSNIQDMDGTINEDIFTNEILDETDDIIGYHIFIFVFKILGICLKEYFSDKFILIKKDLSNILKNLNEDFLKLKNNFEVDNDLSNEEIKNIINQRDKFINEYINNFNDISNLFTLLKNDSYNFPKLIQKLFNQNMDKNEYKEFIIIITPLKSFLFTYILEEKKNYLINKFINNFSLNLILNIGNLFLKIADLYNIFNKDKDLNYLFNNADINIKKLIEENSGLLSKLSEEIDNKCNFNNFYKITIKLINNCKAMYNSLFNFIPQIEIKFNDVPEINKQLIDDLIKKLKEILNNKNFNIVEMKKGSLSITIGLNYLIQEKINNIHKTDINIEEFLKILNETLGIEVNNIKDIIKDNLILTTQNKHIIPNFISETILDLENDESKNKLTNIIRNHIKKDLKNNIFEISQNITIDDIKNSLQKIFKDEKEQQDNLYNIIINPEIQNNLKNFDEQFEKALNNSIFEYNTKTIVYIFRDNEEYKLGQLHCNNIEKKILFHGTNSWCISRILPDNLKFSNKNHSWFGSGIYFSDNLDYIWRYSADSDFETKGNNKNNFVNEVIKIGDCFSFVACEVYYDKDKFEQLNYLDINIEKTSVQKYGIRYYFVDYNGHFMDKEKREKNKKFEGNEYLISEKCQILPLLGITVQRVEFLIIWRDNNFDESNPNKYQYFKEMFEYNYKIKKYISKNKETKIYYFNESNKALEFIKRKIYNKIILITNGANNGEQFLDNARKIIGNNTIALVTCYLASNHLNWVKNKENILLNSKINDCIKEFLDLSFKKDSNGLRILQERIEKDYKKMDESFTFKKIDKNAFIFPKIEKEVKLKDIDFSENETEINDIKKNNNFSKCLLI